MLIEPCFPVFWANQANVPLWLGRRSCGFPLFHRTGTPVEIQDARKRKYRSIEVDKSFAVSASVVLLFEELVKIKISSSIINLFRPMESSLIWSFNASTTHDKENFFRYFYFFFRLYTKDSF